MMKTQLGRATLVAVVVGAAAALAGCGDNAKSVPFEDVPPARITTVVGPTMYDGTTDDLLTAGLGKTGIAGTAPGLSLIHI